MDLSQFSKYHRVPKAWGEEIWLTNQPEYCAKLLVLRGGWQCSKHYHKVKKESFIPLEGVVEIETESAPGEWATLKPGGDCTAWSIAPTVWHRFRSEGPAVLMEISTHHEDADVVRLEESCEVRPVRASTGL